MTYFRCVFYHLTRIFNLCLPLTPVFHVALMYLRPQTTLLETVNENLSLYLLASLRVKRHSLGVEKNGSHNTNSGLSGQIMYNFGSCTSGSNSFSASTTKIKGKNYIN